MFLFDGQLRKKKFEPIKLLDKTGGDESLKMRKYNSSDADEVHKLHQETFSYSKISTDVDLSKMQGWVFDSNGKIVSYLLYTDFDSPTTGKPWYYLEYIGTDIGYQKRGLGKQLIEKFHKKAKKNRTPTFLNVEKDTPLTKRLVKWYSSVGYSIKHEEKSKKASKVTIITMIRPIH
jgi:ribosomal protein S18 acetylase RimI-like enzyme